ncbi:MAG: twin-arginine translocase TatA/TatE family subunit [Planctomycetota bacterium]|nr:MAG: twin-arginine translocase TatA/TatE family subunit [Planctomycetota bacterium]
MEMVLLVLGLLIFGRRLPEVGKSLGQGIKEFKRGLKDDEEPRREEPRREEIRREEPSRRAALPGEQVLASPEATKSATAEHTHTH